MTFQDLKSSDLAGWQPAAAEPAPATEPADPGRIKDARCRMDEGMSGRLPCRKSRDLATASCPLPHPT
jgi:hypothetical protein